MSKTLNKRVEQFNLIKESLFPDGVITPVSEIQERIAAGTHTVRDGLVARFYAKGIAIDPGLLKRDETKDFAKAMQKSFPVGGGSSSRNVEGFAGILNTASRNNISLDSSFAELEQASKSTDFSDNIRTKIVSPITTDVTSVSEGKLVRPSSTVGKGKLAKGAVPPGVLKGIMEGIGNIPDPVMRDAVVASMLGLRGTDLSGIATTAELAEETFPARPYYDPATGTLVSPDPELPGKGKKGSGPDRPLGPVMRQIMERRYAAAVDGELFPDIDTRKIAEALNKYVYPNIDKETLAVLKKQPSGYTDVRRIVASAIANQLGDPQAAAEIISHTGAEGAEKIDRVMTGFYTDVENLDSLEARRSALIGFESLMADATGTMDAKGLGTYLNLDLPETFNAEYPKLEIKGSKVGSAVQVTEATPEQIASDQQLRAAKTAEAAATAELAAQEKSAAAEAKMIERAERAPEIVEAERKLAEARLLKKEEKAAQAAADKKSLYKESLKTIGELYGKVPPPVKKAIPFVGTAAGLAEIPEVQASMRTQMEGMGIPTAVADPLASVGAGINFVAGEVSPITPVDAATAISNIPEVPSMMQQAQAATGERQLDIPKPVSLTPPSFLSNQERLSQAREAARSGTEATGFISYNQ